MSFSRKATLTIDASQVGSSDLTEFTVLLRGTFAELKTVGNGGYLQNSSAFDLNFFSDSGLTTILKWKVRKYVATTGEIVAWIRVTGTTSHTTNTLFYAGFGDSGITTFQGGATGDNWDSNFKFVAHVDDLSLTDDATATGNTLTNSGVTLGTGDIDGCGVFDGSSSMSNTSPTSIPNTFPFTLSCWAEWDTANGVSNFQYIIQSSVYGGGDDILALAISGISGKVYYYQGTAARESTNAPSPNVLHHLMVAFDSASAVRMYIDAVDDSVAQPSGAFVPGASVIRIGALDGNLAYLGAAGNTCRAYEFRISDVGRNAGYAVACFNSQKAGSTFLTMAASTPVSVAGPVGARAVQIANGWEAQKYGART